MFAGGDLAAWHGPGRSGSWPKPRPGITNAVTRRPTRAVLPSSDDGSDAEKREQATMREPEEHEHDKLVHTHAHHHVTHNYNEHTGGFDHLSSFHEHEHDHAALRHSHAPHENFENEHLGEAHVHDHAAPTKPRASRARKSRLGLGARASAVCGLARALSPREEVQSLRSEAPRIASGAHRAHLAGLRATGNP